jgi:hypothetical protein
VSILYVSVQNKKKQELNSSETSCDRVWGLIEGVVKKSVSAWWKEVWLKKVIGNDFENWV